MVWRIWFRTPTSRKCCIRSNVLSSEISGGGRSPDGPCRGPTPSLRIIPFLCQDSYQCGAVVSAEKLCRRRLRFHSS
jgi:hypothetical protein